MLVTLFLNNYTPAILSTSALIALIFYNRCDSQKKLELKLLRIIHNILCATAFISIVVNQSLSTTVYIYSISLSLVALAANTGLLVSLLLLPFTAYGSVKSFYGHIIFTYRYRHEVEEIVANKGKKSFSEVGKEVGILLKKKKEAQKTAVSPPKKDPIFFKSNLLITRKTVSALVIAFIFSRFEVVTALIETFGERPVYSFIMIFSWILMLDTIFIGFKDQILLSGVANKISAAKIEFEAWLKGISAEVRDLAELIARAIATAMMRKYKDATVIQVKIDRIFQGTDTFFDYALNATRLFPLIKTGLSFVFRFFVVGILVGAFLKATILGDVPFYDIILEITKILFSSGNDTFFESAGKYKFMLSQLYIVSWICGFSLFTLLATSFSISITHLSDKARDFYLHYREPLHKIASRLLRTKVTSRDIELVKNGLIKIAKTKEPGTAKEWEKSMGEIETAMKKILEE
jgi:hypothetical protein